MTTTSWKDEELARLREHSEVTELVIDQCMYGLVSRDDLGTAPARKRTRILTLNPPGLVAPEGPRRRTMAI